MSKILTKKQIEEIQARADGVTTSQYGGIEQGRKALEFLNCAYTDIPLLCETVRALRIEITQLKHDQSGFDAEQDYIKEIQTLRKRVEEMKDPHEIVREWAITRFKKEYQSLTPRNIKTTDFVELVELAQAEATKAERERWIGVFRERSSRRDPDNPDESLVRSQVWENAARLLTDNVDETQAYTEAIRQEGEG